jgi:putative tRNA adenosine deaminase-associated protein
MENELSDLALLAWRDEGIWRISELDIDATRDIGLALDALRAKQVNGGCLALLAIDDSFFIVIRQIGMKMQMVLSNVMSALDYEIAAEVLELLDIELPAEDDSDEPAGDLNLLEDLGIDAMELQAICDDDEMFPDEQLEAIARRIGCGDEFLDALESE